jgi:hypothetical protein
VGAGVSAGACEAALELGVGVGDVARPSPRVAPAPKPSSVPGVLSVADGSLDEDPLEGVVSGLKWEPEPLPLRASPTVVLVPSPLKLCPDTSSYVVIPAIVTPKTSAAATTGRFQLLTRAR